MIHLRVVIDESVTPSTCKLFDIKTGEDITPSNFTIRIENDPRYSAGSEWIEVDGVEVECKVVEVRINTIKLS